VDSTWVGVCLDTANSIGAGEGIATITDTLLPHVVNLHLKDFGIRRLPHKQGFIVEGRIAGEGLLDIPHLLERVSARARCETCILEQWVPPLTNPEETRVKEREWAQASIAYIKKYLS
jgi:sugar phosphate isomerase/epimerase